MSTTIYDIAKKAKVSIATVSRAMDPNLRGKVATGTLEKIDRVVRELHYAPNIAARNLTRTSYRTIGVVLPHAKGLFFDSYYSKLLSGISDFLLDSDYKFKLLILKPGEEDWDNYTFREAEGVDGLIVSHWRVFFKDSSTFEKIKVPCVVLSDPQDHLKAINVSADNQQGGELLAQHLYDNGHRKIAILTGPKNSFDSKERLKGFKRQLKKLGVSLDPKLSFCAEFQEGRAYEVADKLVSLKNQYTAIFACNDEMAFGAIRKLRENGIQCPKHVSVVGYDDHKDSEGFMVPLTTIKAPLYEMANKGAEILIEALRNKDMRLIEAFVLPVDLVKRGSVLNIKK